MKDPFDLLRDHLVEAAGQRVARTRRRGLLALVAAFVLAGGGVATALVLQEEPSRPATGTDPVTGFEYTVMLRPDFTAGHIGWCSSLALRHGRSGSFGSGCGAAPGPERPQITSIGMLGQRGGITGMVVSADVALVELPDGRRVRPRADQGVPAPWKLVVATLKDQRSDLRFLDAAGRELPQEDARGGWASGRGRYATDKVSPTRPPDRPCAIRARRLAGLRAVSARLLVRYPSEAPKVAEPAFLSCATTVFYIGRTRLRAAVLVNPFDASQPAALLPGMAAEPAGIVATSDLMSAKRAGPGWLAVYGNNRALRERLLRVLRATP